MIPRFRQSMAKVLLSECPAIFKAQYDAERRAPSRAMEKGTLVDQLVFGGANFTVIDAGDYRTKKAQEARDAARESGMVPVLADEYEPARRLAGAIKARLLAEGIDLSRCHKQETVQWTSAIGTLCEGTPDLWVEAPGGYLTIDLKCGHTANPDRLEYHLYEQGWHIQGAAYQEALNSWKCPGQHFIVCAETKSGADCITIAPLSEMYMSIGRMSWEKAQRIWMTCWERNEWPEYTARLLMPPKSVLVQEGLSS